MKSLIISIGASLLLCSKVCALMCDDIDRQACQLIFNKKSDMCNDTSMASVTCPRFCNECALECYHCDRPVRNFTECNTTRACNDGEVCMLKELRSSTDGHHEYIMNCETKQHCDGVDIAFPFGKRDVNLRNVNAKCCDTDLCNYPAPTPITVTGQPCYDQVPYCDSFGAGKAICSGVYLDWAKRNCQSFCNLCSYRTWPTTPTAVTGGPCSDKLPNCADYPTSVCSEYRPWAQHNCRKYCAYMFCSYRTQPTTPTTVTGGPCKDEIPNCADYQTPICSDHYRPWAQHYCRKFCAYCNSGCSRDLIFVVDESSDVVSNRSDILNFVANVVGTVGVTNHGTHVSLATYSSYARKQFDLDRYNSSSAVQAAIRNVQFIGGYTNTHAALEYVLSHAIKQFAGDRPNVPDTVVLITPKMTQPSIGNIRDFRALSNIPTFIVIGVGQSVDTHVVDQIASSMGHVIQARTPAALHYYKMQGVSKSVYNLPGDNRRTMWSLIISIVTPQRGSEDVYRASLLVYSKVYALMCDDIDRQACQLIFNKKPDMCNDTHMASVTCPRFCNECALECYHCDHAVRNYDDCNSTRACNDGEVCMLKELQSSTDGHHEYIMNCETKQHCDGVDIAFPFGKRDINVRNVNAKCCDTDLCNYPAPTPISVTGTTPYAVKTTAGPCYDRISNCDAYDKLACVEPYLSWAKQNCERTCNLCNLGCKRDVIFIIDESNSQMSSRTEILDFLNDVVGDMIIGDQGTRIALATYASYARYQFGLNSYHYKYDIQAALKTVWFHGGISNTHTGLDFALSHATTAVAGDRANVPDIVVLITDKLTQSSVGNTNDLSLLRTIHKLIVVGIGPNVQTHVASQVGNRISSSSTSVIQAGSPAALSRNKSQLNREICT